MYDYDSRYRRLRAAGLQGWAGDQCDRNLARIAETVHRLQRECLPAPPARLLELGCGNGVSFAWLMARSGYEVHGVDISETAIAWAGELFAANDLAAAFQHGDVCDMPFFDPASFDIVIDGSCLHCLIGDDRARCLAEVRRILRPQGVFVVSSMCGLPKSETARVCFDSRNWQLLEHGRPYRTLKPLPEIARELHLAGFEVQDSRVRANAWWDHVTMTCRIGPASAEPC